MSPFAQKIQKYHRLKKKKIRKETKIIFPEFLSFLLFF
jgi:hypothetical protein